MKEKNADRIAPECIAVDCKVQKSLGQTLVRRPACRAFFILFFSSPPPFRRRSSGPQWLTFWTCGDWWALCPWQDQDWMAKGKMQLFHIDKQGKKCHLQHVEIDAVIRFKSTSHYWTPMAGLVKRVSTYKKKKKENKMRECRYISPQQISIKI